MTMSFIEGAALDAFLQTKPPAAVRSLIGERLVELFYFQLHRLRALQADHHPGNYLFHPDGRIGLVDFGCVKHIAFDVAKMTRGSGPKSYQAIAARTARIMTVGTK